ncbi:MAG TPA: thioredoxin [Acidimicrobiales bacterium]|nr:thioredoxin [Acidimicrobiales bacterium]
MPIDTTDATFEQDVIARSSVVPVIVDLWAPWCGPCRTLGPTIEKVVDESDGAVELVKLNVDENPQVSAAFGVQSIPAVYALRDGKVVDGFIGAVPESAVREFVSRLTPAPSEADQLVVLGDESSIRRALELEPDHPGAITSLASILVEKGDADEALSLLGRIPETEETRRIAAAARLARHPEKADDGSLDERFSELLANVKTDEDARQEYLDLLETMDSEDPRRERFRRALAAQLF